MHALYPYIPPVTLPPVLLALAAAAYVFFAPNHQIADDATCVNPFPHVPFEHRTDWTQELRRNS